MGYSLYYFCYKIIIELVFMDYQFIQNIQEAIQEAEQSGLYKATNHLTGYSGEKFMGCLQRLAALNVSEDKVYLEIGVFQGMTLLSVANAVHPHDVFGIDNFAFFDSENKNFSIVKERREKNQLHNAHVINMDYEDALMQLEQHLGNRKIGVYFIDGPHDYRSQLVCLLLAKPYLADDAIIIIDDSNYRHVRQANNDFLMGHPEFKLIFEAYTPCHPLNMNEEQIADARKGWWDGVNIMVRDKENILAPMYPPTYRSRQLYENEHRLHTVRFPESGILGQDLADAAYSGKIFKTIKLYFSFLKKYFNRKGDTPKFSYTNTYSEDLPKYNLNQNIAQKV